MRLQGPQKTVTLTVGAVLLTGSLAWASVPFYSWFSRVTGFDGTPGTAAAGSAVVLDQTIKIRFDTSLNGDMPWEFTAMVGEMELKIGETGLAFFEVYNPTDRVVAGSASYNVTPFVTGEYFTKIACFCFEPQVLQPGERVQMPVSFYVDPEIVNNRVANGVSRITLSYTFFEIDPPDETQAALSPAAGTRYN